MNTVDTEKEKRSRLDSDYVDERHIKSFRDALNYEDHSVPCDDTITRSNSLVSLSNLTVSGVEPIVSQSDWTPVYNKTKKRKSWSEDRKLFTPNTPGTPNKTTFEDDKAGTNPLFWSNYDDFSLTFTILRYPLLFFIICWTTVLSLLYFLVRSCIAFSEKVVLTRDRKRSQLVNNLRESSSYAEYIENCKKLDKYLGLDEWCNEDRHKYYDWRNLRRTVVNLRKLRHGKKYEDLMVLLQTCVKSNFAGTENPLMYSHCYYGTKKLIERYNTEVVKCLQVIIDSKEINLREKRIFFKIVNKNYGRTCLVLSGGASFCYNHFGVLKALIENDLMPKIISGTSGGGMIAALAATRNNDELLKIITPKLACKMNAFGQEPTWKWVKRWWNTGARFDSVDWARKGQWWTTGSTTFEESYKKTGKILNISTVPNDIHSPTILCNYITSPNCCIWSAMLASAAVPGILNPIMLMEKTKDNSIRPFSLGSKWKDGSLRTDVPLSTLNMYFNTKFSIVSQVNPHVMLWIFKNRGDIGKPVVRSRGKTFRGGFILSYLENLIKLEIIKWLKLVKEFQLFPNLLESDWSNLFLQNFGGTITLFPKIVLSDYLYILSDPTEEKLARIIKNGENITYPKLLFIKHRLNIERTIEKGLEASRIDIDSTYNAPKDLVTNIIENPTNFDVAYTSDGNYKDDGYVVDEEETEEKDEVDKEEFYYQENKKMNDCKKTFQETSGSEKASNPILSDHSDTNDGDDDNDEDYDDDDDDDDDDEDGNGALENKAQKYFDDGSQTNLGFLGIKMNIAPENTSGESYDEYQYSSHESEPDQKNDTH